MEFLTLIQILLFLNVNDIVITAMIIIIIETIIIITTTITILLLSLHEKFIYMRVFQIKLELINQIAGIYAPKVLYNGYYLCFINFMKHKYTFAFQNSLSILKK